MNAHITLRRLLVVIVPITAVIMVVWLKRSPDAESQQQEVRRLYLRGDYELAEQEASILLNGDPHLDEVRLMAADSAAHTGNPALAMQHLDLLKSKRRDVLLQASLLTADLAHYKLFDLQKAESAYNATLLIDADNVPALEGLVRLFGVCGRRREAIPLLLRLVQLHHSSDLLTIAARGTGSIHDPEFLRKAEAAFPGNTGMLVGLALLASRSGQLTESIDLCRRAVAIDPGFNPAIVDLGQYLLTAERFVDLEVWERQLTPETLDFAETWRVRGYLAEHQGHLPHALDYFLQAAKRGPDLKDVDYRLSQLFHKAGESDTAKIFSDRLLQIQQLEIQQDRMFTAGPRNMPEWIQTVTQLRGLGRLWEALGWTQIGLHYQPSSFELRALFAELDTETSNLPLELVAASHNPALRYSAKNYSLPIVPPAQRQPAKSRDDQRSSFSFRNDAAEAGLRFRYTNGVTGPTTHRMFEFTGGGIGVCDLDLDDSPDLFCSQGGLWETRGTATDANDSLFRNLQGDRFVDVTAAAGIREAQFGQGVAVGDLNEDGFPDLFVANIGQNDLWFNNGDGTFSERSDLVTDATGNTWTTSALIADLNLDGAADVYAANYLGGADVFDRICRGDDGSPQACIPSHFDGVRDTLLLNTQDGAFQNRSDTLLAFAAGKGLGVLAWSPRGDGQPSVLVANDTTPNMLLSFGHSSDPVVEESGFASGLAVNAQGKSEGSMGIAAGDLNEDGLSDLLVTNFYNESNTYYQAVDGTSFEDATAAANLVEVSMPMLGFGTQFLDANLDGSLELIVANGHVDDLRSAGKPFQMPTQFFQYIQERFEELPAKGLGDYFTQNHLGRAVVTIDWNLDGYPDLAIGHLLEEYALLTNTCPKSGSVLTLRLIGVNSSRDAVGATVSFHSGDRTFTRQLTAGDGYQASNEKKILFGMEGIDTVELMTIRWPSGRVQEFRDVPMPNRLAILEGRSTLLWLPE